MFLLPYLQTAMFVLCGVPGQEDELAAPRPGWHPKAIARNKSNEWGTGFFYNSLLSLHQHMHHSIYPVRMTHRRDFPLVQLCSWTQVWADDCQCRQQQMSIGTFLVLVSVASSTCHMMTISFFINRSGVSTIWSPDFTRKAEGRVSTCPCLATSQPTEERWLPPCHHFTWVTA